MRDWSTFPLPSIGRHGGQRRDLPLGFRVIAAPKRDIAIGQRHRRIGRGHQFELLGILAGKIEIARLQRELGHRRQHLDVAAIELVGALKGVVGAAEILELHRYLGQLKPIIGIGIVGRDQFGERASRCAQVSVNNRCLILGIGFLRLFLPIVAGGKGCSQEDREQKCAQPVLVVHKGVRLDL